MLIINNIGFSFLIICIHVIGLGSITNRSIPSVSFNTNITTLVVDVSEVKEPGLSHAVAMKDATIVSNDTVAKCAEVITTEFDMLHKNFHGICRGSFIPL